MIKYIERLYKIVNNATRNTVDMLHNQFCLQLVARKILKEKLLKGLGLWFFRGLAFRLIDMFLNQPELQMYWVALLKTSVEMLNLNMKTTIGDIVLFRSVDFTLSRIVLK